MSLGTFLGPLLSFHRLAIAAAGTLVLSVCVCVLFHFFSSFFVVVVASLLCCIVILNTFAQQVKVSRKVVYCALLLHKTGLTHHNSK